MPVEPLFRKVDCLQIPVPDLDSGLAFYRDRLGHELIWRTETAAGLRMPDTDAELVIQTEREDIEVDLLVASAGDAAAAFVEAGGSVVVDHSTFRSAGAPSWKIAGAIALCSWI